jgi:hypothetical protein
MKKTRRQLKLAASALSLLAFAGCLGPNPGFFISSTAAGTAISTVVGRLVGSLLDVQP